MASRDDIASGANRKQWPLQMGFDRFCGFLGGESSQWYPDLVEDNRYLEQPYWPDQGYHEENLPARFYMLA
jgi:arylsulfatase A-like enzyme